MKTDAIKVLVLGSMGFVGKSIVEYLSADPIFKVTGASSSELDLRNKGQVYTKLPVLLKDSTVIITSAITRDKDNSINAMVDNIKMISNIAEVLNNTHPNHLIYISSVDVYGTENIYLPLSESSIIQPTNYYGLAKVSGEFISRIAASDNKIPLTILRLPGIYGPGDTHISPMRVFITNALQRKPIIIKGNGSKKRDFLYIKDVNTIVKQIILEKILGTFNVVSGKSYTINEILRIIENLCNYSLELYYEGDSKDCDLIFMKSPIVDEIKEFEFTDLKIGLKETFEYYKKQLIV